MPKERLQKLLARAGVSSRRAAEALLLEGRVKVNGVVVRELGTKADAARDRIEVDGRVIAREDKAYYLVHKPKNMVTTMSDPEGRPNLGELLKQLPERVYPVGRLDFHTSGVLLVTNDGDLAQALLHPSKEVPKTYVAKLNDVASDRDLERLKNGVTLDDGYRTAPARVTRLRDEEGHTWLEITITEGKNRQIHRMIEAIGLRVMRLSRTRFAGLTSEGLRPSEMRPLDDDEVAGLKRIYQGIVEQPRVPKEREVKKARDARDKGGRDQRRSEGERRGQGGREQRKERTKAGSERPSERRGQGGRDQRSERGARAQRSEQRSVAARDGRARDSREPSVQRGQNAVSENASGPRKTVQKSRGNIAKSFDKSRSPRHKGRTS